MDPVSPKLICFRVTLMVSVCISRCLKEMSCAFIDFILFNFLCHFPENSSKHSAIFFLNKSVKKQKHLCQSKCLRRCLPEVDETRITGEMFRPSGSICDVLNLCSAISFPPWSGVEKMRKIIYCFIVTVNNKIERYHSHKRTQKSTSASHTHSQGIL